MLRSVAIVAWKPSIDKFFERLRCIWLWLFRLCLFLDIFLIFLHDMFRAVESLLFADFSFILRSFFSLKRHWLWRRLLDLFIFLNFANLLQVYSIECFFIVFWNSWIINCYQTHRCTNSFMKCERICISLANEYAIDKTLIVMKMIVLKIRLNERLQEVVLS